ncbi:MAG TPA: FAD-dependent monooxygenase [Gemmatimonadaceae bacterium]|jgi:2-polyprenyl-6-methoxyphenol hydroxylase-like FAD-dependent oxidoreductase|nr:FAD-dependent monooxygenase [Gemmatimonadaceae bacterium]
MPPVPTIDVLVVGAGPTGLTMAVELARHGVRPRLIDQALVPPADTSRALVIQARTLELFDLMGIVDTVLRAGLVAQGVNLVSHRGGRTSVPLSAFQEELDSPYATMLMLPQNETERILAERATSLGIVIERGVALDSFDNADDRVTARLRHTDGHIEETAVRWLIGCDGAHSTVRRGAGIPFDGITYADECLLGDVHIDWSFPDGVLSLCPSPEGVLAAFPITGTHHFRIIMILPRDDTSGGRPPTRDEFEAQLRRMVPPSDPVPTMLDVAWHTRYRLHRRGVPHYRVGRAFVAGDAAHIHSPAGGQGMNTGIQDAINLAWKLALVVRGRAADWLLDTYATERHPVARTLLRGTDLMFAGMVGRGLGGTLLRHVAPSLGLRALLIPAVRRRLVHFVSELGVRYRHSPLSVNAGERAPDATLGTGRMFDLFRHPGHTLLVFGDAAPLDLTRYGAEVVTHLIVDPDVRVKYCLPDGGYCLVRPDGYVGIRTPSRDEMLADMARRFTI